MAGEEKEEQKIHPKIHGDIRIYGEIGNGTVLDFLDRYQELKDESDVLTVEITTPGGDPDCARRIALELKYAQKIDKKIIYLLGKTQVYSAGIIIMAAVPREYRYLSNDCVLLIHERRLDKTVKFSGPMRTNLEIAKELIQQFEMAQIIERRDYNDLAQGSKLSGEEVFRRAKDNWYCTAEEAEKEKMIAGIS